jgi:thiamine biosynthesis lipoprotein
MRRVEQIMGMPITVDIADCRRREVLDKVFDRFRQIDAGFSTYKPESEVSRYRNGEIAESELSAELKGVIAACKKAESRTEGYFSAWAAGTFDPSGYVKGWAIAEAGEIIEGHGYRTYCINAAGDILARSAGARKWEIGIQDPAEPSKILNKLSISNEAVATSGSYERGQHIYNPKTGKPAGELLSVSVRGPDIIWADVLATALFAMGGKAESFIKTQPGYGALLVSK